MMFELLLLAVAPSAFLLWYILRKDTWEPEPLRLVAWVFFLGALSVIPAALVELLFVEGVIMSAVVAPVVEETAKFLVVFLAVYRHPEFDEPVDGIVYAAAAGLGFATLENIVYVVEGGVAVGIVRAIASVPGHVVFSCIWGFALGTAKFRPDRERAGTILTGLAGAMLVHGVFNFSLEVFEVLGLLLILVVIVPLGWLMTCRNIQSAHDDAASAWSAQGRAAAGGGKSVQQPAGIPGTVPDTGTPAQQFCTNCGFRLKAGIRFCENCGREV